MKHRLESAGSFVKEIVGVRKLVVLTQKVKFALGCKMRSFHVFRLDFDDCMEEN